MSTDDACPRPDAVRTSRRHHLVLASAGIAFVAVAAVVLGVAAPAQADVSHTWGAGTSTACVEAHVSSAWDLRTAVHRWNQVDGGPKFVLEKTCADYDDTVTVRYLSSGDDYTGWTTWYWDGTGHLVHADVTVNPERIAAFPTAEQACQRNHTMTHELGHALGLRHYPHSHAGSVMSYLGWQRLCGGLSHHDRADYARLYPATQVADSPAVRTYAGMRLASAETA